jgi:hypothetical protein
LPYSVETGKLEGGDTNLDSALFAVRAPLAGFSVGFPFEHGLMEMRWCPALNDEVVVQPRCGLEIKRSRHTKSLLVPILCTATVFPTLLCDNDDARNAIADWSNIRAVLNSISNRRFRIAGHTADKMKPKKG